MDGISVRDLLLQRSHLFSKQPVIAGHSGVDRLITNVNVMEVPDIYGQVRKGDLLLTTGYSIKDNILAQENLIFGLADRNISAIGIKMNRYLNILPPKMLEQAESFQIPIIDLSYNTNFSLIISEVLEEILKHKTRSIEQAHHDSQHLTNLLIMGASLQTFMEFVSIYLNRKTLLVTDQGDRIGTASEPDWPEYREWNTLPAEFQTIAGVRLLTKRKNGMTYSWYPIGHEADNVGFILYQDNDHHLSTSQMMLLQHAAKLLNLKLGNQRSITDVEEKYREIFLRKWILGEIPDKESVLLQAAAAGLFLHERYVVLIAAFSAEVPKRDSVIREISMLGHGTLVASFDQQVIILVPQPSLKPVLDQPKELTLLKHPGLSIVRMGISTVKPIEDVADAYREAKEAMGIFAVLDPGREFCRADELGVYSLLHHMANHEELLCPALQVIEPLLQESLKQKSELLDTLRCFVHENGNIKETSRKLYCHYNSVLYRLERIERLCGISVRSPESSFRIQLAVRLYDFLCAYKPAVLAKALIGRDANSGTTELIQSGL